MNFASRRKLPAFISFLCLASLAGFVAGTSVASSAILQQGGTVTPPHVIKRVAPVYPKEAREKAIEGTVELHAILAKDGTVKKLDVISGHSIFTQAAIDAAKQWQYSQTLLNGEPVEVDTKITLDFRLRKKNSRKH